MHQESQYLWSGFQPGAEVHQHLLSAVMQTPEDYRHKKGQHPYRPFAVYSSRGNDRCFWPGHPPALWRGMLANQEICPVAELMVPPPAIRRGNHFTEMVIFRLLHLVLHLPGKWTYHELAAHLPQSHRLREEYHHQLFQIESWKRNHP